MRQAFERKLSHLIWRLNDEVMTEILHNGAKLRTAAIQADFSTAARPAQALHSELAHGGWLGSSGDDSNEEKFTSF